MRSTYNSLFNLSDKDTAKFHTNPQIYHLFFTS